DTSDKPIGVLGHDLHGIRSVGLEDTNRSGRADPMTMQEHHDLSHDLLLGPGIGYALGTHSADAGHLSQPIGVGFDYVKHLLSERLHHLLGVDRSDAADHSGAKVFFDALDRRRRGRAQKARLELQAVSVVVYPVAPRSAPFTR